jgi:hypothetical protein
MAADPDARFRSASDLLTFTGFLAAVSGIAFPAIWYRAQHVTPDFSVWATMWPVCFGAVLLISGLATLGLSMAVTALRTALHKSDSPT